MGGLVVCAYSDVGYKCLEWLFDQGESVRLVFTHADAPGEERWFGSVADLARKHGLEPRVVTDLNDPADEERIRAVAAGLPVLVLLQEDDPGARPLGRRSAAP